MNKASSRQICRACLESSRKLYPLVGTVINVDVDIATMISYCISKELYLNEDLPGSVCITCFKTIRIAYNFLRQFKESEEKLLMKLKCNQGTDNLNHKVCDNTEQEKKLSEKIIKIEESTNDYDRNLNTNETNLIKYDLETIHNYAVRCESQDIVDVDMKDDKLGSHNLQEVADTDVNESETEEYTGSLIQYIKNPDKLDDATEILANTSGVIKEFSIWSESGSKSANHEKETLIKTKLVQKDNALNLSGYTCPICNLTFQRLLKFNDHVVLHDANIIVCNKCPRPVELNVSQYIQHFKYHHRYQCNICNRSFMSSYGFRYHMKQHENVRKYECPAKNCKKSFFLLHLLKKHMRTHSDAIKYICNLCGANFRTYDTYRYHQKTHDGNRNHLCTQCGKAFFQAVHLRDHMFRHTGYKCFTCDICGNSFVTNSQLKKHLNHCRKFKEK